MDGSWSVGRENFKHIRSFIASLAGAFDIGEDKTRVAVVQYSTDTRTEFPLTRYTRRGDLLQAINSLPYKGGNTMTGKMFEPLKEVKDVNSLIVGLVLKHFNLRGGPEASIYCSLQYVILIHSHWRCLY